MRTGPGSYKLLIALALCVASPLQARVVSVKIERIVASAGTMQDVRVTLDWPEGAPAGRLRVQAGSLDFPSLAYSARDVDWVCPLSRGTTEGAWRCAGQVAVRGGRRQSLSLDFSTTGTSLVLGAGNSRITYGSRADTPGLSSVQLQKVPVTWLKQFLAGLWKDGNWTGGNMTGNVDVMTPATGAFQVRTDLELAGVGLETPDGLLAAEALRGRLRLDYRQHDGSTDVDTRLTLRGGELLFQGLYAKLPAKPVDVHVTANRTGSAPWRLPLLAWHDKGVLDAKGSALLTDDSTVRDMDMQIDLPDLATARERYLSGFLAPAGFADVLLAGSADARLQMRAGDFSAVGANLRAVNAVDPKARFTFAGVDGKLSWTAGAAPVSSALSWDNAAMFGIGLGKAGFKLSSANGQVRLLQPVAVSALEGKLVLEHLAWQAPRADVGARVVFGMDVQSMDLASLSQRLGWPAFAGTISGRIPSARLERDVLTMDGGVHMDVFGGKINIGKLSMERPFGVAPTLSADVAIEDIDMEPMTRVFGFGAITGRLDGRINGLRLVDWSAEAFDAWLETDSAWPGKRRISQRAVKDISEVGGGGLGSGLQVQALKFFDDFGYERMGIGCKLVDRVCEMEGIGSAGEGYIIVEGAGLPRIKVVGFRRRVDWPTLVARLQAASSGQAPIIE